MAACVGGVAKLPCGVPTLREVEVRRRVLIGVTAGGIEAVVLPSWCTATGNCDASGNGVMNWCGVTVGGQDYVAHKRTEQLP